MFTNIRVSDGTDMRVYLARPEDAGPHPGILVFQEAFAVNAHIRDVAQRFARLGYVAAAPELFHRTAPGFEADYETRIGVTENLQKLTVEGMEADVMAAFNLLRNDSGCNGHVAAIGFCMGGRVAYLANSIAPLTAAVSFYGGGIAPALLDRAAKQNAPLLLIWGGLDKHIGADQRTAVREALDAARKPYIETLFSFADHGFFCDQRASYNPAAARDAWALATSFLLANAAAA